MDLIVKKSMLSGSCTVPSSKSHSLRAVLFSSLAEGTSNIEGLLDSPDTEAMKRGCELLKAGRDTTIDVGNSGLALRLLAGIAALSPHATTLTGDQSICRCRPMGDLLQALNQLGVRTESVDGFAPLTIQGPIKGGTTTLSGHDSQPVSALLIACALASDPTEIVVENPGELPWIDLTLDWMDRLGLRYEREGYSRYWVAGGDTIKPFTYRVPADLSSLAFPVAAALVTGSKIDVDIEIDPRQGDKKLFDILRQMGADIDDRCHVGAGGELCGIDVDINECIDALPVLAAVACFAEGTTRIYNGAVARQKECDRIACAASELRKMGADIDEHDDGLTIKGGGLKGGQVTSHGDHRMAMALAVAGLGADEATRVSDVSCIDKTFPKFASTMQQLGASIEVIS